MIQAQKPEVPQQSTTQASAQTSNPQQVQNIPTATNATPAHLTHELDTGPHKWKLEEHIFHWWHKIALILLIVHGLIGLWESLSFIVFEYAKLNTQLALHQVEAQEVNNLISRAVITGLSTMVNIFFAIRLSKVQETTAHNIDLIVATILIIFTRLIQNYLIQLDLLNVILYTIS